MPREATPESDRLRDAAVDVILERGIAGLSLSELARAIGSNNRMLLYYFGSKDELFTAATLAAYQRFPDLAGLIPSLQGPGELTDLLRAGWRRLRAEGNRAYLRLFFEVLAEVITDPGGNPAQRDTLAAHWPEGMRAAFVAHGWSTTDAARSALQLLSLWRGLQVELLTGADPDALDRAHDQAVDALFGRR